MQPFQKKAGVDAKVSTDQRGTWHRCEHGGLYHFRSPAEARSGPEARIHGDSKNINHICRPNA